MIVCQKWSAYTPTLVLYFPNNIQVPIATEETPYVTVYSVMNVARHQPDFFLCRYTDAVWNPMYGQHIDGKDKLFPALAVHAAEELCFLQDRQSLHAARGFTQEYREKRPSYYL